MEKLHKNICCDVVFLYENKRVNWAATHHCSIAHIHTHSHTSATPSPSTSPLSGGGDTGGLSTDEIVGIAVGVSAGIILMSLLTLIVIILV